MPPKKRKRPSGSQNVASPAAANADSSLATSSPSHPSLADDNEIPPFVNTTFTTHRVSPLYLGSNPLSQDRLDALSQSLRDVLVGDVVRGVEVGLDRDAADGAMRRAGALEMVGMGWIRLEGLVGRYVAGENQEGQDSRVSDSPGARHSPGLGSGSPGKRRVLQISLQYENAECTALLLPNFKEKPGYQSTDTSVLDPDATPVSLSNLSGGDKCDVNDNDTSFLQLPLLLLRMPAPLRTVIIDFISRAFDCRISPLSLGTRSLVGTLERWIAVSKLAMKGQFAKDVVLTLGFYGPTVTHHPQDQANSNGQRSAAGGDMCDIHSQEPNLGIATIDVIIPNSDMRRFTRAGQNYEVKRELGLSRPPSDHEEQGVGDTRDAYGPEKRRRLGGNKDEEGWTWRPMPSPNNGSANLAVPKPQPFTEALAQYICKHLALDMLHPAVRVTKIACGGFALSERRVKIFGVAPSSDGFTELSNTQQRAVWSVLEGLVERAQVKAVD